MTSTTDSIAAEVRAELARHRRRTKDVAQALDVTVSTASRKINGHSPFTAAELVTLADLLGVTPGRFYSPDVDAPAVQSPSPYGEVA